MPKTIGKVIEQENIAISLNKKITMLKNDIVNLEKKKINKILNFIIKVFSFGCINKNKKVETMINVKNTEIKRLSLESGNVYNMVNNITDSNIINQDKNIFNDQLVNNEESYLPSLANDIKNRIITV